MCVGGEVYLPPPPIVSTSEAHGPLARLALGSARVSHPLQYYTAPHTPVVAPQATTYALPVSGYLAQPGYVQRVVDVPTAKVATARLQVRRPAIQKQFYDIEQRTIVRPVGSAVVELEEPLSKNYVSPFTNHHTVPRYPHQLVYPVSPYPFGPYAPFQVPVQAYPPSFIQRPQFIGQQPVLAPRPPQESPSFPQPPQEARPPISPPVEAQPPQQFPLLPQPSKPDDESETSEFDSSDTVVIENPDFDRSASRPRALPQGKQKTLSPSKAEGNDIEETINYQHSQDKNEYQLDKVYQARTQDIINEFQNRHLLRVFMRKQPILQPLPQFQQILPLHSLNQIQQLSPRKLDDVKSIQRSQGLPSFEPIDHDSGSKTSTESTSTADITKEEVTEVITEDSVKETTSTTESSSDVPTSSLDSQESVQRLQIRQYSSEQIPTLRHLNPEEAQENQQKLIELLTGQGEVSEIDISKSGIKLSVVGDSGVVRGRVLSVTSAPPAQQIGGENVSTRRVVVSRPIQTLEEVDVQQPFTAVERVAVPEPALLKTVPHPYVTRVSTAIPFLAPTPTAVVYH